MGERERKERKEREKREEREHTSLLKRGHSTPDFLSTCGNWLQVTLDA